MIEFTANEKVQLVNNIKEICNYLLSNIVPKIRSEIYIKMEVNKGQYPLSFGIWPNRIKCFSIGRDAINSSKYYLPNELEKHSFYSKKDHAHNLFESYEEMYTIIKNWNMIKDTCINKANADFEIKNTINNFKI